MTTERTEARIRRAKASQANGRKWGGLAKHDAVQAWLHGWRGKTHLYPVKCSRQLLRHLAFRGLQYKGRADPTDAAWIEQRVTREIELWRKTK